MKTVWPLAPLTFHCLQLGLVLSARGIHIPLDAVCMTEQAAVLRFCCLFVAGIEKYSDFLILICFHINLGSFKMYSFFVHSHIMNFISSFQILRHVFLA